MNKEYLYATRLYDGLLQEIEKKSSIRWRSGGLPISMSHILSGLISEEKYLIIMCIFGKPALAYGDPDYGEVVLSGPDFVKKCVDLMPKEAENE